MSFKSGSKESEKKGVKTFYKQQLVKMNSDQKYGYNWIRNLENIEENEKARLYKTYDFTMSSGSVYIALPAKKILTAKEIEMYNIRNV